MVGDPPERGRPARAAPSTYDGELVGVGARDARCGSRPTPRSACSTSWSTPTTRVAASGPASPRGPSSTCSSTVCARSAARRWTRRRHDGSRPGSGSSRPPPAARRRWTRAPSYPNRSLTECAWCRSATWTTRGRCSSSTSRCRATSRARRASRDGAGRLDEAVLAHTVRRRRRQPGGVRRRASWPLSPCCGSTAPAAGPRTTSPRTRREFRGRGLARLLKSHSLHRAAEAGVTLAITDNDETNAPMLAVNTALGYRPFARRVEWERRPADA